MKRRQAWLGGMLAATLLATWLAAGVEDEGAAAAQAAPVAARSATRQGSGNGGDPGKAAVDPQAALLAQLGRMDRSRERMPEPVRDPFSAARFQPPPPPPSPPQPAAVVAAKPAAPPLPFQYQGLLRQGDKLAVFLADGSGLLIAREGDTLGGQYRVERLTEKEIILQYLPLDERQTLSF